MLLEACYALKFIEPGDFNKCNIVPTLDANHIVFTHISSISIFELYFVARYLFIFSLFTNLCSCILLSELSVFDKEDFSFRCIKENVSCDLTDARDEASENPFMDNESDGGNTIYNFLYPDKELLPDDKEMSVYDHLEELRERIFMSVLAVGASMLGCFAFSKELIMFLEAPVSAQGVRFLQLAPGEFFFTSLKVLS